MQTTWLSMAQTTTGLLQLFLILLAAMFTKAGIISTTEMKDVIDLPSIVTNFKALQKEPVESLNSDSLVFSRSQTTQIVSLVRQKL